MLRAQPRRGFSLGLITSALSMLACQDNAERVSYAPLPAASGNAAPTQREARATPTQQAPARLPDQTASGPDEDGDGISRTRDQCPSVPEDRDGFEDEDGCPDPDNDRDEVLDVSDLCPNDAEDRDGVQDEDGCPE